ncbi:unnamed protein product [Ceratitis capitata]|uniref:(Mediterranean fruit fly) hypothetical protein n=1 Tax=Ceratitis capitata TaxID=7213 RepID=A0A811UBL7_CERCA|nr:unnamed protein product [Ceratitis capitata]
MNSICPKNDIWETNSAVCNCDEPTNVKKALSSDEASAWKLAMKEERDRSIVKRNAYGAHIRHEAEPGRKSFSQKHEIDYA